MQQLENIKAIYITFYSSSPYVSCYMILPSSYASCGEFWFTCFPLRGGVQTWARQISLTVSTHEPAARSLQSNYPIRFFRLNLVVYYYYWCWYCYYYYLFALFTFPHYPSENLLSHLTSPCLPTPPPFGKKKCHTYTKASRTFRHLHLRDSQKGDHLQRWRSEICSRNSLFGQWPWVGLTQRPFLLFGMNSFKCGRWMPTKSMKFWGKKKELFFCLT